MRKHARRVDANQSIIVSGLRDIGCSVLVVSHVGGEMPDLIVGFRFRTMLLEVKDGDKPASARKLTPHQIMFRASWRGHYAVVKNLDEAIQAVIEATGDWGLWKSGNVFSG